MNLLKRLFGIKPDPTAEWPRIELGLPQFDLRTNQVGELKFGSHLNAAKTFGRPDKYIESTKSNLCLFYTRAGFSLEYTDGLLDMVSFHTGFDGFGLEPFRLIPSKPWIIACDGSGHELSNHSDLEALTSIFGTPDPPYADSHSEWTRNDITYGADFDQGGSLICLFFVKYQPLQK